MHLIAQASHAHMHLIAQGSYAHMRLVTQPRKVALQGSDVFAHLTNIEFEVTDVAAHVRDIRLQFGNPQLLHNSFLQHNVHRLSPAKV
jgi:hypothetical protein